MPTARAIGIDLGTTNSCVGVFQNGDVEILANEDGKRTTPSVVGFIDGNQVVGQWAKNRMHKHPSNVIFCIKRLIGRKINDPKVAKDIENLPFKIVKKNGNAAVQVRFCGKTNVFTPEQICALILKDLVDIARKYLQYEIKDAVITIPAYFNDSQRQATIDAARIAGLNVLRIINEPTAAALAYGYKQKWKEGIILVYDLGGGTFDVSLIKVTNGCCEVLAVDGDDHLGGEDFDNLLVKHCIAEFKHDISNSPDALCRIKSACEDVKKLLTKKEFALVNLVKLSGNLDFKYQITQARFNELCKELVEKTLGPVKNVLEIAKLEKKDVTNVLLVGGSTRIPYIRKRLFEFFDQKNLNFDINPDEAVAHGATLLAAHLSKQFDTSIQNISLLDVIPRSIGGHAYRNNTDKKGYFNVIFKRHNPFPCDFTYRVHTLFDNQKYLPLNIYESEDELVENMKLLGTFELTELTPAPAGEVVAEVTARIDENGILTVTASEIGKQNTNSITIQQNKGLLTENEIIRMVDEIFPPIMEIDLDDD